MQNSTFEKLLASYARGDVFASPVFPKASETALAPGQYVARSRPDKFCGASFRIGKRIAGRQDAGELEQRIITEAQTRALELNRKR